jgi:peroxiredoxin
MQLLGELESTYSKDSLEILLISLDDDLHEIRDRIRQDSIPYHFVADSAGQSIRLFDTYNVNSLPKSFLIDKEGTIVLNTKSGEELKQAVDDILKYYQHESINH